MRVIAICFLSLLIGCSPSITIGEKFVLNDIECQWAEISASLSSKQLSTLCKDENGNWKLVATVGRPGGQIISEVIRGAVLGAAVGAVVQTFKDTDFGTSIDLSFGD